MAKEKEILEYKLDITDVEAKAQRIKELSAEISAKRGRGEDTSALEGQLEKQIGAVGRLGREEKKTASETENLVRHKNKLANAVSLVGGQCGGLVSQLGGVVELLMQAGPAAAGWIGRLEARADGLWACGVQWTRKARELIAGGEYKYFSPVIHWAGKYGADVGALGPAAITNVPAMRHTPTLAASRDTRRPSMYTVLVGRLVPLTRNAGSVLKGRAKQGETAMIEQIAEALGLGSDAGVESILEAIGSLQARLEEAQGTGAVTASRAGRVAAGPVQRSVVIAAARRSFAAESADPRKTVICSEKAWVHTALRDVGQQPLTAKEIATHGIATS